MATWQVTHDFSVPAERVYDAWLDARMILRWTNLALRDLGESTVLQQVEVDPRVGGSILLTELWYEKIIQQRATYVELDRPHRIVSTRFAPMGARPPLHINPRINTGSGRIVLSLEPIAGGCRATLIHGSEREDDGRSDARWQQRLVPKFRAQFERAYGCMLAAVEKVLQD